MLIRFFHNHTPTTINTTPTSPTKVVSKTAAPSDWPHVDTNSTPTPPLIMTTAATFLTRSIKLDPIQPVEVMHPCPLEPASTFMANRPYDSRYWREVLRPRILSRDNHRCQIRYPETCEGAGNLVDHIIPWEQGGPWYDEWNLRAACKPCNNRRQHRPEPLTKTNSRDW